MFEYFTGIFPDFLGHLKNLFRILLLIRFDNIFLTPNHLIFKKREKMLSQTMLISIN